MYSLHLFFCSAHIRRSSRVVGLLVLWQNTTLNAADSDIEWRAYSAWRWPFALLSSGVDTHTVLAAPHCSVYTCTVSDHFTSLPFIGFGGQQADSAAISTPASQQQLPEASRSVVIDTVPVPLGLSVSSSDNRRAEPASLPSVSREAVLGACTRVSLLLAVMGLGLHQLAPFISPVAVLEGQGDAVRALLECEYSGQSSLLHRLIGISTLF